VIKGKEYVEEKLIAEGGYGYVYIVEDLQGQKYALKKMNIQVRIWVYIFRIVIK
jgi:hypothetical protein